MNKTDFPTIEEYQEYLWNTVKVHKPLEPRRPTAHRVLYIPKSSTSPKRYTPQYWNKRIHAWESYWNDQDEAITYPTREEAQEYCRKERRLEHLLIYDNGGRSIDRYTAVFKVGPIGHNQNWELTYECLSFSSSPFHPQGFGQYGEAVVGRHLGRRIKLSDLNDDCLQFVLQNL